jgi:DNA-binding NtrC family response regulator
VCIWVKNDISKKELSKISQAMKSEKKSRKMLVVDDEVDIGFLMKMLLSSEGYEVSYAQNLKRAKELLREAEFNTVFLDLNLENEFGLDLVPTIRLLNQDTLIVVITAQREPSIREKVEASDVDFLIEKPFDKQKILSVIKSPQ